jgi:uncharacterized repeat protein (TIGR01451 family)
MFVAAVTAFAVSGLGGPAAFAQTIPDGDPSSAVESTAEATPSPTATEEPAPEVVEEPAPDVSEPPPALPEEPAPEVTDPAPEPAVPGEALLETPTIDSDFDVYTPGSLVKLTGEKWQGDTSVTILVDDTLRKTWSRLVTVSVTPEGTIADEFLLPTTFVALYNVTATGVETGRVATAQFADDELSWDQCQNDSDNNGKQNNCSWTNGALGPNNSIYGEGDVVPQRHIRAIGDAGKHYTTFDHSFYDASKNAYTYDLWATPDFTVKQYLNACAELPNPLGLTAAMCNQLLAARTEIPLPTESTFPTDVDTYTYPGVAGAEADFLNDGGTRNMWFSCGTLGGTQQQPTITPTECTDVKLEILGHGDNNKNLLPDQDGPPTVEDFVQMKVSYTTPAPNTVVAIWVGGHLAKASYWNEKAPEGYRAFGAATAAGASFHQRLIGWDLNQAIGNRDNQVQAGAVVPPANLTIIKRDLTNSSMSFDFTATPAPPLSNFSLTDDGTKSFLSIPAGTYNVAETVPLNWTFKGIECTSLLNSSTYNILGPNVEVLLQPGDSVTCTFTNDQETGTIDVTKVGPEKSKIGDKAQYTVTIENTGPITLYRQSISDSLAGDLVAMTSPTKVSDTCGTSLAVGASCTIVYDYTVPEEALDPLLNTVTALYDSKSDLTGNEATASANWTVNLFTADFKIEKTGDALSKIDDEVTDYESEL